MSLMIKTIRKNTETNRLDTLDIVYKLVYPFKEHDGEAGVHLWLVNALANFDYGKSEIAVLLDTGTPVGFALVLDGRGSQTAAPHLHLLSVLPPHQGKGHGTKLIKHLQEKYKDISIEAKPYAESFFTANNFKRKSKNIEGSGVITMHFGPNEEKENFYKVDVETGSKAWDSYIDEFEILMQEYRRMKAS